MSWRELPFTPNRQVIHDMLARARRFHAPVTGSFELDVTDTRRAIRAVRKRGLKIGLVTYLVRATAMLVRESPSLQRHLFTTWYGRPREVAFDHISCTLIVARKGPTGETLLLPLVIPDVDRLGLAELDALVAHHRDAPLESLEQFQALERVKRAPRLALRWFSYKARSDPEFYLKYFGTYGLSSLIDPGGPMTAMSTYANTAVAFLPSTLKERPWLHEGRIVPREILNMSIVVDHNLIDGAECLRLGHRLRTLLEEPDEVLGEHAAE
ncbi:2-oxo acid dehydrogenase subunit E2 [Myxococcota bacterium]|nr:2-oxo acid dehydrogenase subunit E2 [Myxococcota bacterium]